MNQNERKNELIRAIAKARMRVTTLFAELETALNQLHELETEYLILNDHNPAGLN